MKSIGLVGAGDDADGLGEQVEPGRVEAAAEGEVGGEPPADPREPRGRPSPMTEQDLLGVAGDQVHDGAHIADSVARPSA